MALWRTAMVIVGLSIVPRLWPTLAGRVGLAFFLPMMLAAGWMGNAQPLVVALAVLGGPAGVGMALGIRPFPVILLPFYAARHQWRSLAIAVSVAAMLWLPMLLFPLSGCPAPRGFWPGDLAPLLALL
jgi:hypothetical protein